MSPRIRYIKLISVSGEWGDSCHNFYVGVVRSDMKRCDLSVTSHLYISDCIFPADFFPLYRVIFFFVLLHSIGPKTVIAYASRTKDTFVIQIRAVYKYETFDTTKFSHYILENFSAIYYFYHA